MINQDGILAILIFILLILFEKYNESQITPCPSYCDIQHEHIIEEN